MNFVYSLFLQRTGEELSQFDNRISNMLPVAAGLVFLICETIVMIMGNLMFI